MISLAEEYRQSAYDAHVLETEAPDEFCRRMHGKLSRHWLELAERVERENGRRSHRE
jgi:hypothetical protein